MAKPSIPVFDDERIVGQDITIAFLRRGNGPSDALPRSYFPVQYAADACAGRLTRRPAASGSCLLGILSFEGNAPRRACLSRQRARIVHGSSSTFKPGRQGADAS